jgi:tetratricopeptide (TPR) repeat protein
MTRSRRPRQPNREPGNKSLPGRAGPRVGKRQREQPLLSGRRLWGLRLALVFAAPAVFLLLLEGILTLFHVGYPTTFFVAGDQRGVVVTNSHFGWHYQQQAFTEPQPCLLSVEKPKDAIRIFVLGESAAMGTPDPSFGFARILEVMLQPYFPGHRLEVVNAAMRGINSHLLTQIARECAALHPDLFVVYMGNNEFIGLYGLRTPLSFLGKHPGLIPVFHFVKRTRTGQLLRRVLGANPEARQSRPETRTADFFRAHYTARDDPEREYVYRNFRTNLERICRYGLDAGAGLVVSTMSVNLRDCPPLGSLHRPDLTPAQQTRWEEVYRKAIILESGGDISQAVTSYEQAAALDDHYAELHFRLARCRLRAGAQDTAADQFALARDWDALPFRADGRINEVIRAVAGACGGTERGPAADGRAPAGGTSSLGGKSLRLVETDKALAGSERCPDGIPGQEFFYEYVHLRFPGDYEVARALLPAVVEALRERGLTPAGPAPRAAAAPDATAATPAESTLKPGSVELPTYEQCAHALAFTRWDEVNTAAAMVKMTANPPFTGQLEHAQRQAAAQRAVAAVTDHIDEAFVNQVLRDYQEALAARPQDWCLHYNLGAFLQELGRPQEAARQFDYVVRLLPHVAAFHVLLGRAQADAGRLDEATREFREALRRDPSYGPAREGLSRSRRMKKGAAAGR